MSITGRIYLFKGLRRIYFGKGRKNRIFIDGRETQIMSGAMHYFRTLPEQFRGLISVSVTVFLRSIPNG